MYVLKYTYVNENHHYFVRCTNRDKDCIQKSTLKSSCVIRPIVISE